MLVSFTSQRNIATLAPRSPANDAVNSRPAASRILKGSQRDLIHAHMARTNCGPLSCAAGVADEGSASIRLCTQTWYPSIASHRIDASTKNSRLAVKYGTCSSLQAPRSRSRHFLSSFTCGLVGSPDTRFPHRVYPLSLVGPRHAPLGSVFKGNNPLRPTTLIHTGGRHM